MKYTEAQKAEAVGLAIAIGDKAAGERTGIPRRTVSYWRSRPDSAPLLNAAIVETSQDVAARLWRAVEVGTDQVLSGLQDPKARLGEKAKALEIVQHAHALLTGGVTGRSQNENLNVNAEISDDDLTVFYQYIRQQQELEQQESHRQWRQRLLDGALTLEEQSKLYSWVGHRRAGIR
jgi:hypothetical protein